MAYSEKREAPKRTEASTNEETKERVTSLDCRHITEGLVVSTIIGHFVVQYIVEHWLWPYATRKHGFEYEKEKAYLSGWVGLVERLICFMALVVVGTEGWRGIAAWLALKVAARWQAKTGTALKDSDNIWLIGTATSLGFGILGAWIALGWQLPK